jgi:hypothetical protein
MALENKDKVNNSAEDALEMGIEVLRDILKSKTGANLYMDEPSLYNKINLCIDVLDYQLSRQQKPKTK